MIMKKCEYCEKNYETIHKNQKYCSYKCHDRAKNFHKKVKRKCLKCGKEFKISFAKIKIGHGKYCSKSCAFSGDNHPNWKGGIANEPYCELFNDDFKERVREFWGRRCVISGTTERENGRRLDVHHVNYDKETCCNTTKPLFVAVSKEWNLRFNHNRDYWEEYLTNYIMIWFGGKCYLSSEEEEK